MVQAASPVSRILVFGHWLGSRVAAMFLVEGATVMTGECIRINCGQHLDETSTRALCPTCLLYALRAARGDCIRFGEVQASKSNACRKAMLSCSRERSISNEGRPRPALFIADGPLHRRLLISELADFDRGLVLPNPS
jgi:hypothetical protein